jgi:hypothetical protein
MDMVARIIADVMALRLLGIVPRMLIPSYFYNFGTDVELSVTALSTAGNPFQLFVSPLVIDSIKA